MSDDQIFALALALGMTLFVMLAQVLSTPQTRRRTPMLKRFRRWWLVRRIRRAQPS